MTSKRAPKKISYIPRNITPKKAVIQLGNKSEHISTTNDNRTYAKRNNNIYKNGYASVNREKPKKYLNRPIETSPSANHSTNIVNNDIYLNIIKKKNYAKKLQNDINQRPQSATPSKLNIKYKTNENNLSEKNVNEINLDMAKPINKKSNKEFINNRENMVNMLINNYNKKSINLNCNANNEVSNNYMKNPLTAINNSKNYIKKPLLNAPSYELKNPKKIIKYPYNKIKSREKQNFNKKRIVGKNFERDMTEPELLKMTNPIKINDAKREYQKTLNISLNNREQNNAFLHQKANKMIRYNTNNDPRYNQYYLNNSQQNNPQIFNNYVSINNLVTPNFPVKLINVFDQ